MVLRTNFVIFQTYFRAIWCQFIMSMMSRFWPTISTQIESGLAWQLTGPTVGNGQMALQSSIRIGLRANRQVMMKTVLKCTKRESGMMHDVRLRAVSISFSINQNFQFYQNKIWLTFRLHVWGTYHSRLWWRWCSDPFKAHLSWWTSLGLKSLG